MQLFKINVVFFYVFRLFIYINNYLNIMKQQEIKNYLCERGNQETILFENPNYETAFIGVSTDGRAIYDYNKMIEYLMFSDAIDEETATEFIEFNTIGATTFENCPIIFYPVEQ